VRRQVWPGETKRSPVARSSRNGGVDDLTRGSVDQHLLDLFVLKLASHDGAANVTIR
jgi:hypothetical protein